MMKRPRSLPDIVIFIEYSGNLLMDHRNFRLAMVKYNAQNSLTESSCRNVRAIIINRERSCFEPAGSLNFNPKYLIRL